MLQEIGIDVESKPLVWDYSTRTPDVTCEAIEWHSHYYVVEITKEDLDEIKSFLNNYANREEIEEIWLVGLQELLEMSVTDLKSKFGFGHGLILFRYLTGSREA